MSAEFPSLPGMPQLHRMNRGYRVACDLYYGEGATENEAWASWREVSELRKQQPLQKLVSISIKKRHW